MSRCYTTSALGFWFVLKGEMSYIVVHIVYSAGTVLCVFCNGEQNFSPLQNGYIKGKVNKKET